MWKGEMCHRADRNMSRQVLKSSLYAQSFDNSDMKIVHLYLLSTDHASSKSR
jgi:hypothetical protein